MKFSSTAIATLAITAPSDRARGFLAEQDQEGTEHTFARFCGLWPSPPREPSSSAFPSTAPVEVPSVPSCMPKFENFDEVCEDRLQFTSLATPSCRTPCNEWEGMPDANFVLSGDICSNCITDENGDEYCIDTSGDGYGFIYSPSSDWDEYVGERFTFRQSGSLSSGSTVQFLYAENSSTPISSEADLEDSVFCRVAVDGMECNSCTFLYNTTGHLWWDVDCSNTPAVDSPTRVDLHSGNLHREPTIGYDHPLFALTDRALYGICYSQWFPEEEAPSAAPVEGDCVSTSGFDEELCDWYTTSRSYLQCLNPCDDWVGGIRSNIAFLDSWCSGCHAGDNGEEYCVEKDDITYYLSRDFNASAAAEWPFRSWTRMELGTSVRFNQTGLASSGAFVEYIAYDGVFPEKCDVKIDGQLCNSCIVYFEQDYEVGVDYEVLTVDCSNVEGVDAAVSFNLTREYDTSDTLKFYRGLLPEVPMDHPLFALTARVQRDCGFYLNLHPIDEAPSAAPVEGDCDPESGYDQELCNARLGGNCANPCDDWPGEIRSNIVRYPGWSSDCSGCVNEGEEDEYCLDMTRAYYYLSFGFNASDPSWTRGTDYLDLGDAYIFNSSGINSHAVTLTYDSHDYNACWVTVDGEYCDSCVEKYFRIYPVRFNGIEVDCRNLGIGDAPFQFNYYSTSQNSNDPEVPMDHTLYALTNRAKWGVCEGREEGRLPAPALDKPAVNNDQDRQPRPFMPWRRFGNRPEERGQFS